MLITAKRNLQIRMTERKLADDSGNFWFSPDDHERKTPTATDKSENLESHSVQIVRYYLSDKLLC